MPDLIPIMERFGLPVALVVYMLWRDWQQGKQRNKEFEMLISRITTVEDYQRGRLEQLVEKGQGVISENTAAFRELTSTIRASNWLTQDVLKDNNR